MAAEQTSDHDALVTLLNNRGVWFIDTGRLDLAEIDLRRALLHPGEVERHRRGAAQHNLGLCLARQGLVREGLTQLDQALEVLESRTYLASEVLRDKCEVLLRARVIDEAAEAAAEIAATAFGHGAAPLVPEANMMEAHVAVARGRLEEAADYARRAEALFGQQGRDNSRQQASDVATALTGAIGAVADDGPLVVAEALLLRAATTSDPVVARAALEAVETRGAATTQDRVLARFAAASRLASMMHDRAAQEVDACFEAIAETASEFDSLELRSRCVSSLVPIENFAAGLAHRSGRADWFTKWIDRSRSIVHDRQVMTTARPELVAGLELLRQTVAKSDADDTGGSRQVQLLEKRIRTLARLTAPGIEAPRSRPQDAPLRRHTATITFGTNGSSLLATVTGRSIVDHSPIVDLGPLAERVEQIGRLQFAVSLVARDSPPPGTRQLTAVVGLAAGLDDAILGPLTPWLSDATTIVIVAQGALASLPWKMFPTLDGAVVSIGSSVTASPEGVPTGLGSASMSVIVGPNVEARDEAMSIGGIYANCDIMTGDDATVANVARVLSESDVVHIAAHGRLEHHDPLLSSLELADGRLTLYDIESLPSVAHTVVLSSCRIAGAAQTNTSYGLGTVLRSRGCRQVIATALPLADRHAPTIMQSLHSDLAGKGDAAAVLAELRSDDPFADIAARSLVCLA